MGLYMYKINKQQGYIVQPLFCNNFKWSITFYFLYVATIKFLITYMAHIMFLLGSAALDNNGYLCKKDLETQPQ